MAVQKRRVAGGVLAQLRRLEWSICDFRCWSFLIRNVPSENLQIENGFIVFLAALGGASWICWEIWESSLFEP